MTDLDKRKLDPHPRGLPSVSEARAQRKKMKFFPARYWMWAFVCIGAALIVWWKVEEGEINTMRNELLARQRAVVAELGPRWLPLRDKIEQWTAECGREAFVDEVDEGIKDGSWNFREMPGIYLRLAQTATKSPETIREAAQKSLRDGFTACLLVVDNESPLAGPECTTTADCPRGQMCNEFDHCAKHSQPFNLRLAFKTLHVMTDEWVADIQDISNKLAMRGAQATFEGINDYDLPVAVDLLTRSKYFLVVVDEPAAEGEGDALQALPEVEDAGAQDDRSIPTAPHPARVCLWRLEDGKKMLALRRDASGVLRGPGMQNVPPETQVAQQRQANSCALALSVREEIGGVQGVALPEEAAGGRDGGAAPDAGQGGGASP